MSKKIVAVLLSLSLATPAFAGGRHDNYSGYSSGYGRSGGGYERRLDNHRRTGRGAGTALALIGGVILGAAIAKGAQRNTRDVVYVERAHAPRCYDQQVTERTISGRLVTYTETVCD